MSMKKKILSVAVLAALGAGTAQAVNIGTDGTGQTLLFPYYTVQGGESTLLSVVNSTPFGKLVKIRFREAYNSREVLDFNIYLSPEDVWTGSVVAVGDGAGIVSRDNTCTVPALGDDPIPFRSYAYDGTVGSADTGPQGIERTKEGYVEIIEMGVAIQPTTGVWDSNGNNIPDYLHDNTGMPDNCAGIDAMVASGWGGNFNTQVARPLGGLFGELAVINVEDGTEISIGATALEDVFTGPQHFDTGTLSPTLADAKDVSLSLVNDDLTQAPVVLVEDWSNENGGIDAVSAVLMAANVMNEYTVNPGVGAETAWVFTFPTKWFYTEGTVDPALMPFTMTFDGKTSPNVAGQACELVGMIAYDREELGIVPGGNDFSPRPEQPGIFLCYETTVMQVGESNVMSSANTTLKFEGVPGKNGWINVDMTTDPDHAMVGDNITLTGLPVIGFRASVIKREAASANYGTSTDHVYSRQTSAP